MDKLIFLGTGHALAYHCYSTCLALTDGTHTFMTDAGSGNGVLLQMERAGLTSDDITDLFISHRHTDHLIGAIWLVRVIGHSFDRGRTEPLTVYGERERAGNPAQLLRYAFGHKRRQTSRQRNLLPPGERRRELQHRAMAGDIFLTPAPAKPCSTAGARVSQTANPSSFSATNR